MHPSATSAPARRQTIGFVPSADIERTTTAPAYTPNDRTLLRTDTGRLSVISQRSGISIPRRNTLEARTVIPTDFRTVSIQINEGGVGERSGTVKGMSVDPPLTSGICALGQVVR